MFLTIRRDLTEGGEWCKNIFGYREGIIRLFPSPQVGSWWYQRGHQTLRSRVIPCRFYRSLIVSQESKDVKEKAKQLIPWLPWLNRLKENLATAADEIDLEEEQRRTELSRYVSSCSLRHSLTRFQLLGGDRREIAGLAGEEKGGGIP